MVKKRNMHTRQIKNELIDREVVREEEREKTRDKERPKERGWRKHRLQKFNIEK